MMSDSQRRGLTLGVCSYLLWGILPLYWYLLQAVAPFEILLHRIIWSFVFVGGVVFWKLRGSIKSQAKIITKNKKTFLQLTACSALISGNWFLYVWAVNSGYVLQTSLGYFINPIISVLIGALFLKETLKKRQKLAIALVAAAILALIIYGGEFPFVALGLAGSFSLYGLLKKLLNVDALLGLAFETMLAFVPGILILSYLLYSRESAILHLSPLTLVFLIGTGVVTATPLWLYARAVQYVPLAWMGIMQYIAPSMQFALGVGFFGEKLDIVRMACFVCVWIAIVIFLSALRSNKEEV